MVLMAMLDTSNVQEPFVVEDQASLDPLYYYEILKKRKFYALIPFFCIFAIGWTIVMLMPPTYLSEGKILVEFATDSCGSRPTHRYGNRLGTDRHNSATGDDPG